MKVLFAGDLSFDWLPRPRLTRLAAAFGPALASGRVGKIRAATQARAVGQQLRQNLTGLINRNDAFCANLECVLSDCGAPLAGKKYTLRAAPEYVRGLKAAGLSHVCLANNHILDYGPEVLDQTCRLLKAAGIGYLGLRRGDESRQNGTILDMDGSRLALLNYVDPVIIDPDPVSYLAGETAPYPLDPERVMEDIRVAARSAAVAVVAHWGEEWSFLEAERQRQLARAMIDAGASVVISHHTHLAGAYEEYKHGLITYGLGNLLMMMPAYSMKRGRDRLLASCRFEKNTLADYELIPLSADREMFPTVCDPWPIESMRAGHLPLAAGLPQAVRFDSFASLAEARVTTEMSVVWENEHLASSRVVEGKLPVGPGWRVTGRPWTGVAQSREQAGREFAAVNAAYFDGPGTLRLDFALDPAVERLAVLHGFPGYLRVLPDVQPVELEIRLNGIGLWQTRHDKDVDDRWVLERLAEIGSAADNRLLEVLLTNGSEHMAVCCFRLLGW